MNRLMRRPFGGMTDWPRDLERFFDADLMPWRGLEEGERNWMPSVDIHEDDKAYHVSMDIPGMKADDIDVRADQRVLVICGKRESHVEDKDKRRSERFYGSFRREFTMPDNACLDKIEASYNDGVLNLMVPKRKGGNEARRIEVH